MIPKNLSVQSSNALSSSIPFINNDSVDAVIVAQAFHWMDNISTLKEVHRILKRGQPLVMIWNTFDYENNKWMQQIEDEILAPLYKDTPRQQNRKWENCFKTPFAQEHYQLPVNKWNCRQISTGTESIIYDRIMSISVIAEMNEDDRKVVRNKLKSIIDNHRDLQQSKLNNSYQIDYITEIAWASKK